MVTERAASPPLPLANRSLVDSAATVWAVLQSAATLPATPEVQADTERARTVLRARLARLGITEHDLHEHLRALDDQRRAEAGGGAGNVRCLRSYVEAKGAAGGR